MAAKQLVQARVDGAVKEQAATGAGRDRDLPCPTQCGCC